MEPYKILEFSLNELSENSNLFNAIQERLNSNKCKSNTVILPLCEKECRLYVCFGRTSSNQYGNLYKNNVETYFYKYIVGLIMMKKTLNNAIEIVNVCFTTFSVLEHMISMAINNRNTIIYIPTSMKNDVWNSQVTIYVNLGFNNPVKTNKTINGTLLEYEVVVLSRSTIKSITTEKRETLIKKINKLKYAPLKKVFPIEILFNGNREILNAVSKHDPLLQGIKMQSLALCPLVGSDIKFISLLGEGISGAAFEVNIKGYGKKPFVVKKVKAGGEIFVVKGPINGEKQINIYNKILELTGISKEMIEAFNPNLDFNHEGDFDIMVPTFAIECRLNKEIIFDAIPKTSNKKTVILPPNSYLCESREYSEYYIGAMVGEAYRSTSDTNFCINFFNTFSMFTCLEKDAYFHYTFMDKMSGEYSQSEQCNLHNLYYNDYEIQIRDAIFIQLLFAIAYYQEKYQLSHNDLHTGNLFIECIKPDTEYRNQILNQYQYFHYSIDGDNLYFPAVPILVKIGDFGQSVKYSEPIVGDLKVFQDGYYRIGIGPGMPNYYIPQYDIIYASFAYVDELAETIGVSPFITECIKFLAPDLEGETAIEMSNYMTDVGLLSKVGRPKLTYLFQCKTAKELLQSDIVKRRFPNVVSNQKPTKHNFITLGSMS